MRCLGRALVAAASALIVLLSISGDALAQRPVRSGLWLEGARGTGTVRNTCSGCDAVTAAYGPAAYLRAGGALSPRVLLGLEIFQLSVSDLVFDQGVAPIDADNRSIAPVVIWYVGGGGFFLKGGGGLARGTFSVRTPSGEAVTTKRTGSAFTFGVGFDIPLIRWLALTASLDSNVMAIGDVRADGTVVDDVIATIYQAGIGITLR